MKLLGVTSVRLASFMSFKRRLAELHAQSGLLALAGEAETIEPTYVPQSAVCEALSVISAPLSIL